MALTHTDLLAAALELPIPSGLELRAAPDGTRCVLTGAAVDTGVPYRELQSAAVGDVLDRVDNVHGWVSESAARCYVYRKPGNALNRGHLIVAGGPAYQPLVSREAARAQGRDLWAHVIHDVWPEYEGRQAVIIVTDNTKRRLWPMARATTLGSKTVVLVHDDTWSGHKGLLTMDWRLVLMCHLVVTTTYDNGWSKRAIRDGLLASVPNGMSRMQALGHEKALAQIRHTPEFVLALIIAQRKETPRDRRDS